MKQKQSAEFLEVIQLSQKPSLSYGCIYSRQFTGPIAWDGKLSICSHLRRWLNTEATKDAPVSVMPVWKFPKQEINHRSALSATTGCSTSTQDLDGMDCWSTADQRRKAQFKNTITKWLRWRCAKLLLWYPKRLYKGERAYYSDMQRSNQEWKLLQLIFTPVLVLPDE